MTLDKIVSFVSSGKVLLTALHSIKIIIFICSTSESKSVLRPYREIVFMKTHKGIATLSSWPVKILRSIKVCRRFQLSVTIQISQQQHHKCNK